MSEAVMSIVVASRNSRLAARGNATGQTLVEYSLIIALVSLAAIVALTFLSDEITGIFSRAGNSVNTVTTP